MTVIALTGATGFVGGAVLEAARARGWHVRALARRAMAARAGVEWVRGDLGDGAALTRMFAGVDAVVHVAGVVKAADAAEFAAGNVAGTAAVLHAMAGVGVARLVCVSSLAARAPELSAYGASKAAAEELVRASASDWVIVRPPAVYGPGDSEMLALFRAAARLGVVPMPAGRGGAPGRASLVHVADLARLLLTLVPAGVASGAVLVPDDGRAEGWTHPDLARAIGVAVGRRRVRVLPAPGWLLRLAARGDVWLRGRGAKLTPDRAGYMAHPDWVAEAALRPDPPMWRAEIATPAGLAATAAWYRAAGWL